MSPLPCKHCGVRLYAGTYGGGKTRWIHEWDKDCPNSRRFVYAVERWNDEQIKNDRPTVKSLDLANVMRDAFLAGRGLKAGDKLSEADALAWANYAPEDSGPYERLYSLLNAALSNSERTDG